MSISLIFFYPLPTLPPEEKVSKAIVIGSGEPSPTYLVSNFPLVA